MNFATLINIIISDYKRLNQTSSLPKNKIFIPFGIILLLFSNDSFIITFWYRIGYYLFFKKNIIAKCLLIIVKIIHRINQHIIGIQLPLNTQVNKGLRFFHGTSIIVNGNAKIGYSCSIYQGVTIGRVFGGKNAGCPTIGDNVIIFAGAKVLGNVTIGNNVVIGANAVVTSNIPNNSVVVGIPAKIISTDSSNSIDKIWHKRFYLKE